MRIRANFSTPPQLEQDFMRRIHGTDAGTISAWLAGIDKRKDRPDLAEQAQAGELPVLPFKGGVAKPLKATKPKVGALQYLAMWQGLRGENLDIDLDEEPSITCARHGVQVVFTGQTAKLLASTEDEE